MLDKLYDYQRGNVEYLNLSIGALIADEMGLGKSIQGVARDYVIRQKHDGKTLVVAPLSVLTNWKDHFEKYTNLKVRVINNKSKETRAWLLKDTNFDVAILHWDALRLMPELKTVEWLHIIADEAHRMQNRQAQQTTALKALKATFKTALSGTPVTTSPEKFWSVLNWLYPKDYSSYWKFFGKFVDFDIKIIDGGKRKYREIKGPRQDNLPLLHDKLRPYYRRHLKKKQCCPEHPNGVQPGLPPKMPPVVREVELKPEQKRIYKEMKKAMLAWVGPTGDIPLPAPMAIAKLVRLSQFACSYATVDAQDQVHMTEPSAKLDEFMQLLQETDEKVVVFSQFKQLIKLLEKRLTAKGVKFVSITGDTPGSLRGSIIKQFQEGDARVFCGTIGAAGTGITLTASSLVVFLDRSYSPALNDQAEDRLHRIGQANPVTVVDIVAKGTADRGKLARIETRSAWIRALLGDD